MRKSDRLDRTEMHFRYLNPRKNEEESTWDLTCTCGREYKVALKYFISMNQYHICPRCRQKKAKKSLSGRLRAGLQIKQRDFVGKKFNKLLIISVLSTRYYQHLYKIGKKREVLCLCDCGKTTIVTLDALVLGRTHSCGCYRKEVVSKVIRDIGKARVKASPWKYRINNQGEAELLPKAALWKKHLGYAEELRADPEHGYLLEARCTYCGKWFTPTKDALKLRVRALNGKTSGENRLYCSNNCKVLCPIFGQVTRLKSAVEQTLVREVQPELRRLVFERDSYTCQKCGETADLNCHHYEGIKHNPIESADVDMCITLCSKCHKEAHKDKGCRYVDLRCVA